MIAVGPREVGLGYLVSSLFWGKLLIPGQGDGIHLSTRIDLHSYHLSNIPF